MTTDIRINWETGTVDCPSTTAATKIAELRGGESITIKSLAAAAQAHYIGPDRNVSSSKGFKLGGKEGVTLELPQSIPANKFIEIWALPTVAGDDITFLKLINVKMMV